MNKEDIIKNLNLIRDTLDQKIPVGDIDGIEGKMMELCSMMGLSAECLAEANMQLSVKQGEAIRHIRAKEPSINATLLKLTLESELAYQRMTCDYAERLNKAISHNCDSLRTAISKYKTELTTSILGK